MDDALLESGARVVSRAASAARKLAAEIVPMWKNDSAANTMEFTSALAHLLGCRQIPAALPRLLLSCPTGCCSSKTDKARALDNQQALDKVRLLPQAYG